jgi:alpha-ketoglutarate-dependent 2,4-dichlorophenoxyacetate dioxygenase
MALKLEPLNAEFVAVASGVDLGKPLGAEVVAEIVAALDRYAVLIFRDQPIEQDELVAFARQFGALDAGLQQKLLTKVQSRLGSDVVSDISNVDTAGNVAERTHRQAVMNVGNQFWHTDSAYAHYPFRYSILQGVAAVDWGGQTEFADLRAAYDALDARTKGLIADKVATFYSHFTRQWLGIEDSADELRAYPPVRWPMVRTHPGSGRKLLWCDSKVCEISGLSTPEGRALAHELLEHIAQPERVHGHRWSAGDIVMYDNRSVLHRGRRFDLSERREMRRVSTLDDVHSLGEVPMPRSDAA